MKIHAAGVVTEGDIDFESVVKMSDGLNGADLRNVVTEAYVYLPQMATSDTNLR
jgi:26S proteasome regulatory subunit T4